MQTENNSLEKPVSYYGKKVYYLNNLIARKDKAVKDKSEYFYEDIEDNKD